MCKHQTKRQFLLKLEAAQIANSLPDYQDFERVTGCKVEDFECNPEAIKSAYQLGMNCLFQAGDPFAIRCSLMQQLNLPSFVEVN
jgi:hypothetical protein